MQEIFTQINIFFVTGIFVLSLIVILKTTDILVENAVVLSEIWGLPEMIIGATIVSLGTTLPELSSSVIASLQGGGGFAIGNAVGSTITNTSLVLGAGALFGKIPVSKETSRKLSLLIFVVSLLVLPTLITKIGKDSGLLPQWLGVVFLILIPVYIFILIRQEDKTKKSSVDAEYYEELKKDKNNSKIFITFIKIFLSAIIIALSATSLVDSAEVIAKRIGISDIVISSTIIAFGTSVPEISTTISAVKSNHGGLALGNVMGANILNILFVLGASLALSPGGIIVVNNFYNIHIPVLIIVLAVYGYFAYNKNKNEISKKEGILMIAIYLLYLTGNLISII
ncbi:cation:H+ antiporter [Sedimentibacter acidaminivorans]|uniref:Cation:H+ antiporter n=1 Tax=Sedimentibacter acidaminivorans TaxID=913099 RepID=A0ABS4GC74_9FIRM|nr:calcium/sodium antiporter [Sedimentibacter acidaminivorans]MBP1925282.1 cation:H+ antiporter [Sedimentibacter acidaminivorans]